MATVQASAPAAIMNSAKTPASETMQQPQTITPSNTMTMNGSALTANTPPQNTKSPSNNVTGKRIEVDGMMTEFQKQLGQNWDRYRDVITSFLIGRLSRIELVQELDEILDKKLIHMHNQFLLANLANALRDAPQGENGLLTGWSKKSSDSSRGVKGDTQLAKIKEDIMELTVRERKRIKAIAKDPTKRPTQMAAIQQTRQSMLPRIPFVSEKDKKQQLASPAISSPSPASAAAVAQAAAPQPGNPVAWTQDIVHSYEAQLASEAFELPDPDSLNTRLLGISLEHGLLQGVGQQVSDVIVAGLECYLKEMVGQLVDRVRLRKRANEEDFLQAEDIANVLESSATCFVEMSGPQYRLQDVMLADDDVDMLEAPPNEDKAITPELRTLVQNIISN